MPVDVVDGDGDGDYYFISILFLPVSLILRSLFFFVVSFAFGVHNHVIIMLCLL